MATIEEVGDFIKTAMCIQQTKGSQVTVEIIGHAGIGKSSIPKQVADSEGWESVLVPATAFAEVGDLIGVPMIKDGKTIYLSENEWKCKTFCDDDYLFYGGSLFSSSECLCG